MCEIDFCSHFIILIQFFMILHWVCWICMRVFSCTLKNFSISEKWRVIMNFNSRSLFSKCCTLNINIFFFIFRLLKSSEREFVCNLIRWPVKYSKEISKCWPSGNRWLYNHCLQVEINNLPEAYGSLDWFMLFSKML